MTMKNLMVGMAILASVSSVATAQGSTDAGGVGGAGGAVTSALAPAGLPAAAYGTPQLRAAVASIATSRSTFGAPSAAGVQVSNPAGGQVTVPQALAQAVGAALQGSASGAQQRALATEFGGGDAGRALARALNRMGRDVSNNGTSNAITAYNDAVRALPPGQTPSPTLLAARQVIAAVVEARINAGR